MYTTGWGRYLEFCRALRQPPLPITEHLQTSFAGYLSQQVSWGTIRSYLSAIRFFQIRAGLPDPSTSPSARLPYVLKGIHKLSPDHTRTRRQPITADILRQIQSSWSRTPLSYDKVMLWAAFCLGFFGFMRSGEYTATACGKDSCLSTEDISVDSRSNPQVLTVYLRKSKTDQYSTGNYIYLGRTHNDVCPVTAVLSYLAIRPPTPGPLFIFQNGTPLTRQTLVKHLREALTNIGIDLKGFSGHSFRIGAASAAAAAGINDSLIQTLGRWKSSAFTRYIRNSPKDLAVISTRLAQAEPIASNSN